MQAAEQIMFLEELIEENAQYSDYLKSQVADQSLGNVDFEGATVRQKEVPLCFSKEMNKVEYFMRFTGFLITWKRNGR